MGMIQISSSKLGMGAVTFVRFVNFEMVLDGPSFLVGVLKWGQY